MAVYLCYLGFAGILSLLFCTGEEESRKFNRKCYLVICCIVLVFIAGLRGHTIGADTSVYLNALDYYSKLPTKEILGAPLVYPFDFEIGYFFLTKICAFLGFSKTAFLFVVAVVTYIPLFRTIYKNSKAPYISILVYFAFGLFAYSLGVFRQMIAISIVLCGMNYIREKKFVKYILVIGVAMLFHTTAFIMIPLYFLYMFNLNKLIKWIIPGEIVCLLMGRPLLMIMVSIFPKYEGYVGGMYDVQGGSYLMLALLNIVLFLSIYLWKKGRIEDDLSIKAIIVACMVQAIGYSMGIAGRLVPYYSVFMVFAFPDILYTSSKRTRVIWRLIIVAILFAITIKLLGGNTYVCPYFMAFDN